MTFTEFNKSNLTSLRKEMNELLQKYGVSANIDFSVGNMKFRDTEVEIKVSAKIKGAKTFSNTVLETRAASLGLKLVNASGDKLVDYNPRAYKKPFIFMKASDGKKYCCDIVYAKALFSK
jgi:hypothetical protein